VEVEAGEFATEQTHVTFSGTAAWGEDADLRFHVTSADWQESDEVLAGILTDFGARTGPVAFGGRGEFDGGMTGPFRRPRVEGRFTGEDMRAWDTLWGDGSARIVVENSYVTVRDAVLRTSLFKAFELTDAGLQCFVDKVRSERPAMLFGYPSVFARIAAYAKATSQPLDRSGVRVVFVTSERLYPDQRALIREVFGCPVANGYGGRDAGFIAHECPAGGMHISAEDIVVEIVDADGRQKPPGESGEIVVTHLATSGFPFVRYRTGDIGALDERVCPCGRGLPMLKEIEGRTTDFVVAQDGTVMHGLALIYVVRELPGIRKFKIVQETVDHTKVMLVPEGSLDASVAQRIREGMKRRLGAGVSVDVDVVDDIPAEASGKYRYVVSKAVAR